MRRGMVIDLKRCIGCYGCAVACKAENGTSPGVFWMRVFEEEVGRYPNAGRRFVPLRCNHCASPPCVPVCPTGASYKRDSDGLVLVDYEACIGCGSCIVACPYQARSASNGQQYYYAEGPTPYEQHHPRKPPVGVAQKCTFCVHRLDQGLEPACVQTCPTRALTFGDLDDPSSPVVQLIRERRAVQPRADLGADPSLYYLY